MDKQFEQAWEKVKTERDELRLQMHLARAEFKDEWEETLEPKWEEAQRKFDDALEETEDAAREVQNGLSVVAEELSAAYKRIRDRLKE